MSTFREYVSNEMGLKTSDTQPKGKQRRGFANSEYFADISRLNYEISSASRVVLDTTGITSEPAPESFSIQLDDTDKPAEEYLKDLERLSRDYLGRHGFFTEREEVYHGRSAAELSMNFQNGSDGRRLNASIDQLYNRIHVSLTATYITDSSDSMTEEEVWPRELIE